MFCRKCLKEGKKVNMNVDIQEKKYQCPKCLDEINWEKPIYEEIKNDNKL